MYFMADLYHMPAKLENDCIRENAVLIRGCEAWNGKSTLILHQEICSKINEREWNSVLGKVKDVKMQKDTVQKVLYLFAKIEGLALGMD
ncbi:MAG: hypothetical protein HDQ95_03610 [Roseburia sp.]|nr:hypothetical protein [Roseburia sp.]